MTHDLTDAPDLVTLFHERVAAHPDAEAVAFVADPSDLDGGVLRWSYARLDQEARARAAWLREHLPSGARVLLLHPSGLEFVAALWGCLYAGMIAVPAPLPGGHRHHRRRLAAIARDSGAAAVLTTEAHLTEVGEWVADLPDASLLVVAGDLLGADGPREWRPVPLDRSTIAVLQYTSGSTGDPKGVVLQHEQILFNTLVGAGALGFGGRVGGWLPQYHDMGLFSQIMWPLLLGGSTVLMAPTAFIRRPVQWLRMIDAFGIGFSFAPNFAFDLCTRKVRDQDLVGLDLSRWQVAGCGSEPIDARVLGAFSDRFAAAGLDPRAVTACYGMAETAVYISVDVAGPLKTRRVDLEALARGEFTPAVADRAGRDLVGCGRPDASYDTRVVDPETGEVLPEGRLGEIWLRGRSVSPGYWRRDDNADVFDATTADGDGGYLRTGDLGVFSDGELYVHGRLKDLIIVHGRNIYPQDIEHELRAQHPELGRAGVVFAGPGAASGDDGSSVVVTHEVAGVAADRLPALAAEIRHTVGREFGIAVATVALVKPGTVLRTTSGKVRRSAMRDLFHEGRLVSLHQDPRQGLADPATPG
ncbi:fatty acyl-AMP ligase [Streptomyces sp. NPDC088789]|uniref:fatty acyl-AMP ligase n=1 Tax=Streptomyces sp. NPDC088789 TaxID=3365899 RepID=UPI0037FBAA12